MDFVFIERGAKKKSLKKILAVFLCFTCFFALMLELSGADPDKKWSWRSYVEYVTENIKPFPDVELTISYPEDASAWQKFGDFLSWCGKLFIYPFAVLFTCIHNVFVFVYGLFPIKLSGDFGEFGSFPGGGFGGGGGGIR